MSKKKLHWRSNIGILQKIICGCSLLALAYLTVLIIADLNTKGKGIEYYLTIVIPLLSIASGMGAMVVKRFWWLISIILHVGIFVYIWLVSATEIYGYVPWAIGYLAISGLVGYAFKDLTERR